MYKNLLIIGAARSGKSTLARLVSKKFGYNVLSIDNLISGFEKIPSCGIMHDGADEETSKNIEPFLEGLFTEISEGSNFYNGVKYVIEGTHIDFSKLMDFMNTDNMKEKFIVIGLTYNNVTVDEMYQNIRKYDTEDDWTYWNSDEELYGNVKYFLERNEWFSKMFKEYNILTFDTSVDREKVMDKIIEELKEVL